MFDAQGFKEKAQLVRGAVGDEHLDVFREQFDGALAISGELGEKSEIFQAVALWDFSILDAENDLLELIAAQDDRGLPHDLAPGGLARGVELLHRHTALQLGSVLSCKHRSHPLPDIRVSINEPTCYGRVGEGFKQNNPVRQCTQWESVLSVLD